MSDGQNDSPFFILGAARSGTTMLRLMLNRHPRLAIPPESHFLLPLLEEIPLRGELSQTERLRAAEIIIRHPRFRTWHVSDNVVMKEFSARDACCLRDLIDCVFRLEIAGSRKPRWGDKTPRYYACWKGLSLLFPESKFVHIIRDGRDVSASLEGLGWHGQTEHERARYWKSRVRMALESLRELGPQRSMIVRYEELVLETQATLTRVCAFLREDYDPAMMNFYEDASSHVSDFDGQVHDKLNRPPGPDDVQRWRNGAQTDRLLCFESVAGAELEEAGYELFFDWNKFSMEDGEETSEDHRIL